MDANLLLKGIDKVEYKNVFVEFVDGVSSEKTKNVTNRLVLKVVFEKRYCIFFHGLQISMDVNEEASTESDGSKPGKLVAKLLGDPGEPNGEPSSSALNFGRASRCSVGGILLALDAGNLLDFSFVNVDGAYRGSRDYM